MHGLRQGGAMALCGWGWAGDSLRLGGEWGLFAAGGCRGDGLRHEHRGTGGDGAHPEGQTGTRATAKEGGGETARSPTGG